MKVAPTEDGTSESVKIHDPSTGLVDADTHHPDPSREGGDEVDIKAGTVPALPSGGRKTKRKSEGTRKKERTTHSPSQGQNEKQIKIVRFRDEFTQVTLFLMVIFAWFMGVLFDGLFVLNSRFSTFVFRASSPPPDFPIYFSKHWNA